MQWVNDAGKLGMTAGIISSYAYLEDNSGVSVGNIFRIEGFDHYLAVVPSVSFLQTEFSDPLEAKEWIENEYLRSVICAG